MTGVKAIPGKAAGVTLIETMVVVAIVAIMAAVVLPSFGTLLEKMRLRNAAEALYSDLNYAKSMALKTKQPVYLSFTPGAEGAWCWGIDTTTCDCSVAGACQFVDGDAATEHVTSGADYPGATLPDGQLTFSTINGFKATVFEPVRGTTIIPGQPARAGTAVIVSTTGNHSKGVVVSNLGRVSMQSDHYETQ